MKIGTLEQIGAQVGDTVEDTRNGVTFEIKKIEFGVATGPTTWLCGDGCHDRWSMDGIEDWRIISNRNFIEVGGVYVSVNGGKWECVAINDDKAFCRYEGVWEAYEFNLDGTPVHISAMLNLKPMQETKDLCVDGEKIGTIDVVNGKPDFNTVKEAGE